MVHSVLITSPEWVAGVKVFGQGQAITHGGLHIEWIIMRGVATSNGSLPPHLFGSDHAQSCSTSSLAPWAVEIVLGSAVTPFVLEPSARLPDFGSALDGAVLGSDG